MVSLWIHSKGQDVDPSMNDKKMRVKFDCGAEGY